jgi:histone-lysine N-methyltransferase SETMAR
MCTTAYGKDGAKRSTVQKWYDLFEKGAVSLRDAEKPGRPPKFLDADKVEDLVKNHPYISAGQIAFELSLAKATIKRILTEDLGLVKKFYKWIPHTLEPSHKLKRVEMCRDLLVAVKSDLNVIITGDESWCYWEYENDFVWTTPCADRPRKARKTIEKRKIMLIVFWSIQGFHLIHFLPENCTVNAAYFLTNIITPLNATLSTLVESPKKILLHMDNASAHNAKVVTNYLETSCMERLPHPPYSPDIAPSDYFLFGCMKQRMKGLHATSRDELTSKITDILMSIDKSILERTYKNWEKRLSWVIDAHGEYIV